MYVSVLGGYMMLKELPIFLLQMSESPEAIMVNLREKKRWRKYPCVVKSSHFVIYRDSKVGRPCMDTHNDLLHLLFHCS